MDAYTKLAREAVAEYLKSGKIIHPPKNLPKKMLTEKAGVFVSIHEKEDEDLPRRRAPRGRGRRPRREVSVLRGCIGTFLPTKPSIAEEIIANALSAATADPRFPSVSRNELPGLIYSVDILSEPNRVSKIRDLDIRRYGLIVSTSDGRRGLLLPDIPGIKTPEEQFQICCLKAGISPEEKVIFQTFTVERHH